MNGRPLFLDITVLNADLQVMHIEVEAVAERTVGPGGVRSGRIVGTYCLLWACYVIDCITVSMSGIWPAGVSA